MQRSNIGNPKYKRGDIVHFKFMMNDVITDLIGEVYIVDAYGTFEQDEEPSYDIMVENWCDTRAPCLIKHIKESEIINLKDLGKCQ